MKMPEGELIRVSKKRVLFEDGKLIHSEDFIVMRNCVTISQYRDFAAATGYLTTSQRSGDLESYLMHYSIEDVPAERVGMLPVSLVSWEDADNYCKWIGGRLMSEVEWLAASISDWSAEQESTPSSNMAQKEYADRRNQMVISGPEWLAAEENAQMAPIRNYPRYYLVPGWQLALAKNRIDAKKTFFTQGLSFRVCML